MRSFCVIRLPRSFLDWICLKVLTKSPLQFVVLYRSQGECQKAGCTEKQGKNGRLALPSLPIRQEIRNTKPTILIKHSNCHFIFAATQPNSPVNICNFFEIMHIVAKFALITMIMLHGFAAHHPLRIFSILQVVFFRDIDYLAPYAVS